MINTLGSHDEKILLTGSLGFIGMNLMPYLEGYEVDCWDTKLDKNIFNELFDGAVWDSDVVIHLAALTSVEQSFRNPSEVFATNVLGTARVVELCRKYNKKLIYPSSAAIYHAELSPYAETKSLAEKIVLGVKDSIETVVFRFYNIYGEHMNKDSGSVMYNFLHDKKIVVYGDGEQTRDFINVKDICSIICDAIGNPEWVGEIVDVGTGQAYTMNYIAGLFAHYRKLKIQYEPPRREIKWSKADISRLQMFYKKPLVTDLRKDIQDLCKN